MSAWLGVKRHHGFMHNSRHYEYAPIWAGIVLLGAARLLLPLLGLH